MLVVQEGGEMRPQRLALGRDHFLEQIVLNVMRQMAPDPDDGLPRACESCCAVSLQTAMANVSSGWRSACFRGTPAAGSRMPDCRFYPTTIR